MNYGKVAYVGSKNSFKHRGALTTSLVLPGSCGAGAEVTVSASITLDENQIFVFARGKYREYTKESFSPAAAKWQPIPSFDLYVDTSIGPLTAYLLAKINNNVVTFTLGIKNPTGGGITITPETIDIEYILYTLSR